MKKHENLIYSAVGLAALFLFVISIRRYQRRTISRLSLIVTGAVSIGVMVLAISPAV